ncbi:nischarin isoform X5 [Octopus bimaculoides]|uniref:nischarin isoform X5 n=1 Tax=Octopus bimaculoides TaxID=37653 RepID=UPI00071CC0C8|nr:nischarin isoform X5 [Octopus bimaculoides]|eukprot:XP_014790736.1 PREDICTED: nischarin-like isoform X5 [Octopus bimaculoides]
MSQFGRDLDNFSACRTVRIIGSECVENYTVYVIEVTIGPYTWCVRHRYSDFHDLHDKLVSTFKIDKSLLPPKKLFGNQSETFIKKRQNDLEVYLQTILFYLAQKIPPVLAYFLDFNKYEIHGITQALAEDLYNRGELILQAKEPFQMSTLHLYALTERLKLPEPTCDSGDVKKDIGHILDFITRLKHLKICGSRDPVGSSNIDMNELRFDLTLFKSLQTLEILNCNSLLITGFETIKQTLQRIEAHHSMKEIKDLLLQEYSHWRDEDGTLIVEFWNHIIEADFSHNSIKCIDESVQLLPQVEHLDLSHNFIDTIQNLQWLSQLTSLNLSHNNIDHLDSLHTKLGNLKTLNLAGNRIKHLQCLSKLFSLVNLDISNNDISDINEVKHVSGLPCMEKLSMVANSVTIVLDYRTKVLAMFLERANEICLDHMKASQKELDTVAVVLAIQKSKENKEKLRKLMPNKNFSDVDSLSRDSSPRSTLPVMSSTPPLSSKLLPTTAPPTFTSAAVTAAASANAPRLVTTVTAAAAAATTTTAATTDEAPVSANADTTTNSIETTPPPPSDTETTTRDNSNSSCELDCIQNPSPPNYPQVKQHLQRPKDFPQEVKSYVFKFEHLPSVLNCNFCTKLISNLTGSNETKRKGEICEYVEYLFWSYAVQYTHPTIMNPTCVVLTQKHIFIQHFDGYSQDFPGVPHTTTYYILPLCNIQRILISHNVVQLEESFVGPSGIFLLYQVESPQIKTFTDILKKCYQNNTDQEVPKIIDISGQLYFSDLIENVETKEGLYSSEITFTAIVIYDATWHTLAVSENYLYLVETEDFFFNTDCFVSENPDSDAVEKNNKHSILKYYPIMAGGNVSFKWCPNGSKQLRFPEILNNVRYELHPLSMEFNCQGKTECLALHFLSAKTRDEYLEKFTSLRALNVNRLSLAARQEPEGANEDNDVECKKLLVTNDDIVLTKDCLTINHSSSLTVSSPNSSSSLKTPVSVQDVRRPSFTMPCEEQLTYLTQCNLTYKLVKSRSPCLESIGKMNGYELIQFFHTNFAHIGFENEEMMYVVWADVVPYRNPDQEILSLVVLTSRAVYCISDTKVKLPPKSKHTWMTHYRHKSDSAIDDHLIQGKSEDSHCSGILHKGGFQHSQLPRAFITIPLSQLVQVNIGMFNQCLRFTGPSDDLVCTVVTRDCATTEIFLQVTFSVLSSNVVTSADTPSDSEMDFYSLVTKSRSATEGSEYIHPSKVRFCYPGEETISDILYIISDISREQVLLNLKTPYLIWIYILGFQIPMEASVSEAVDKAIPRTVILTNRHICLVAEDLVSYPLPDFARGLPDKPRHRILDVRKIEYLKRILVDSEPLKCLTLVFSDEDDEIDVDASFEYYSPKEELQGRVSPPEISVRLLFQKGKEEEKLLQMLKRQWAEIHSSAELPVHTTTWLKQDIYSTSQGSTGCHTLS